jgi:hypothetical protein
VFQMANLADFPSSSVHHLSRNGNDNICSIDFVFFLKHCQMYFAQLVCRIISWPIQDGCRFIMCMFDVLANLSNHGQLHVMCLRNHE